MHKTSEINREELEALLMIVALVRNARWSIPGADEALRRLDEVRAKFRCPLEWCDQRTPHSHGELMTERRK